MSYGMNGWCKTNDDTISRQETIDALFSYLNGKKCPDDGTTVAKLIKEYVINKIPSVQLDLEEDEDIPMEYFENGGI